MGTMHATWCMVLLTALGAVFSQLQHGNAPTACCMCPGREQVWRAARQGAALTPLSMTCLYAPCQPDPSTAMPRSSSISQSCPVRQAYLMSAAGVYYTLRRAAVHGPPGRPNAQDADQGGRHHARLHAGRHPREPACVSCRFDLHAARWHGWMPRQHCPVLQAAPGQAASASESSFYFGHMLTHGLCNVPCGCRGGGRLWQLAWRGSRMTCWACCSRQDVDSILLGRCIGAMSDWLVLRPVGMCVSQRRLGQISCSEYAFLTAGGGRRGEEDDGRGAVGGCARHHGRRCGCSHPAEACASAPAQDSATPGHRLPGSC